MKRKEKRALWAGFVDGKIHFYRDPDYYGCPWDGRTLFPTLFP